MLIEKPLVSSRITVRNYQKSDFEHIVRELLSSLESKTLKNLVFNPYEKCALRNANSFLLTV